jgi:hypothetical protein
MAGCPVEKWVGVSVMGRVMGSIPAVSKFNFIMLGKKTAPVNQTDSKAERGLEMAGQTV